MIRVSSDISIDNEKIRYEAVRSSGPGGQHVNKVSTAIILRYKINAKYYPKWFMQELNKVAGKKINKDGILIIKAKKYRTQLRNKKAAFERLLKLFTVTAKINKSRKKTKIPLKAIENRIKKKKLRSQKKLMRKAPNNLDE